MSSKQEDAINFLRKPNLVKRKISEISFFSREQQNWDSKHYHIMEDISINGYNPNNNHPLISKDNVIIDGNHRLVMLQELYGDDYELEFSFINYKYNRLIIVGNLLLIVFGIKRFFKRLFKIK